jgi:hypothetical protein
VAQPVKTRLAARLVVSSTVGVGVAEDLAQVQERAQEMLHLKAVRREAEVAIRSKC